MAINSPSKLRVMVDANVLVAGIGWPRFPYEVLRHAVAGDIQLVLSPFIIEETRRHLQRLFPDVLPRFEELLTVTEYEAVPSPSKDELTHYPDLVRDVNDIPVALAAMNAQVDYLISADKDLTDPDEPIHQHLKVVLPGTFLRKHMGWTSEELETIRTRTWKDIPVDSSSP